MFISVMDGGSGSSTGLEWKNLALYGGNSVEIPEQVGFSMCSSGGDNNLYFNDLGTGSSSKNSDSGSVQFSDHKDALVGLGKVGSLPLQRTMYDEVMRVQNANGNISSSGSESMIGLRLGRQKEYGDNFPRGSTTKTAISSLPVSSMATKRSRASQNMQNPCCQVEGCNLELTSAKDYHRRHRICESHSKSPKVVVAGKERRFCQQCSRFHELSEFDDKKRSCRRRLSDHNARRRRLQPESIQFGSTGLSSALYDRRPRNVLLNGLPISVSTWENAGSSILSQARDSVTRPSNAAGFERTTTVSFTNDEIPNSVSILSMNPGSRVLDQCSHVPVINSSMALELQSAHSLLSSNSWSLNEADSTSMESLVHGNYNPFWARFQFDNVAAEQGVPVSAANLDNAGASQLQEFQLFKVPYESGCFNSSQRNL